MTLPTRSDDRDCGLVANASEKAIVGNAVPGVPSDKFDLDGQIFPHTEQPPCGGRDVEGAIPYDCFFGSIRNQP